MHEVEYSILGPLSVRLAPDAEPVVLGEKLRLLLGRLLLEPGITFSVDKLGTDVWGEERELANVNNTVHHAVRQARNRLGDTGQTREIIVNVGAGYRIVVGDLMRIDAERFKLLAARGHALVAQHPRAARAMLVEALSYWRGRLLGDHAELGWAAGHAAELDALRVSAQIDLNEARIALGEWDRLESGLERQIIERPADERLRGQLLRTLVGAGRRAEAGLKYRDAVRDLGTISPELRRLGDAIGRGVPLPERSSAPAGRFAASREAGALLCASISPHERERGRPGLGMLALLIDRHGGEPHPLNGHQIVARFDTAEAALRAAEGVAHDSRLHAAVAIHAGGVLAFGDRLAGPGPARCLLMASAAHPGQVLISDQARALLGDVELRDLGEQRFDDLLISERVYERGAGDEESRFPPPETLERTPHNLPVQRTRFIGRVRELDGLSHSVAAGQLLTLLGPGGCGKTRLALQLAAGRARVRTFPDGIWFVSLAELEPELDVDALAVAIGGAVGVRPLPDEPADAALARHLADRRALLVLDNCEHVVSACVGVLTRLRDSCSRLCVIATSRRPLRLDGERPVEVPALGLETDDAPDSLSDAVELLLERAGALPAAGDHRALDAATRICRAFEGWPLAIELAAAHVSTRGLEGVAAEVEAMFRGERGLTHFELADPQRPRRLWTIDAAIAWSHRLLTPVQRTVLHRLSVFRGTFGLVEAQRVAAGADLTAAEVATIVRGLVDHSLLATEPPLLGAERLRLRQPIRTFAAAQLDPAEYEALRARHADVYCALATAIAPDLFGRREGAALERLDAEHDNLRAALQWLIDRRDAEAALGLIGKLWWLWFSHGHFEEGGTFIRAALALDGAPSLRRVRALRAGSHLAWWRGDYALTATYNRELEACARAVGDEWGLAWAPMAYAAEQMFANPVHALALFGESRRRFSALGRDWEAAYALHITGGAHWFGGDAGAAGEAYGAAAEIFERLEHGSVLASARRGEGLMAARGGRAEHGAALCRDALRLSDAIGDRAGSAQALNFLAAISRDERDIETAAARYADALVLAREIGELWAICMALDGIAGVACERHEWELGARLLACSQRLARGSGYLQSPHERRLREGDEQRLRTVLGRRDFERATSEGQLLSTGDAVTAALAFVQRFV